MSFERCVCTDSCFLLATKLGRTPLSVDLDPADNALSVPGTLAVAPMTASAMTVEPGLPPATPLVMWYGSTSLDNTDLFKAQVQAMSQKMDQRMEGDSDSARASGIIVNTNGWIQDVSKYDIVTCERMQL